MKLDGGKQIISICFSLFTPSAKTYLFKVLTAASRVFREKCSVLFLFMPIKVGGRHSTAVTRPHCNDKDVGSNPAAARNENWTLGKAPCTEGAPVVQQDLNGRPAM